MPTESLKYNYDGKFDVLYIALGDRSNSYGDDSERGLVYLRDIDTDELTGVTIMNFWRKYAANALPKLPFKIDGVLSELKKKICNGIDC